MFIRNSICLCFFVLFGISSTVFGQTKIFRIDTGKILLNRNLDFFVKELATAKFTVLRSKKEIPVFIKSAIPQLNDKSLADPNEKYQATDVVGEELPWRKLTFLAKSNSIYVVTYLQGGIGTTSHIVFIRYHDNKVEDLWAGYGCFKCKTIKDILTYINENRNKKWGLNTNIVDL